MSKELLFSVTAADCKWDFFCSGGPGGQRQNKVATACRCTHKASGAVGECREHSMQGQNKKEAFARMAKTPTMQAWLKIEASKHLVSSEERRRRASAIEDAVEKEMSPKNLKFEIKQNGKWVEVAEHELEASVDE